MQFSKELIQLVWNKAIVVDGTDETMFRKDACGAWIRRDMYGVQDNELGWEIDHIFPQSLGGTDELINLRALQHDNNRQKGDDYPNYEAAVTSDGARNVERHRFLVINDAMQTMLRKIYSNA